MSTSVLFEHGTVISFDDETQDLRILYDTSVLVIADRIAAIFDSSSGSPVTVPSDAQKVSAANKIISPGFIDTHRHGWQTAYRTIAANTTLAEYFKHYSQFSQAAKVFTPEDIYYGQLAGIYECLNAGVTSALDHCHGTFSPEASAASLKASIESGIRMWWCYGFIDYNDAQVADFHAIHRSEDLATSNLVQMGMAYDGWMSASSAEAQSVIQLAKEFDMAVLTTHTMAGPWIIDHGPSTLAKFNSLDTPFPIIFSHASFLSPADAALLRKHNHYVSITPESEMHYGHGHPNTPFIQDQSALGIDSAFTFSADIVTQARIWLQATRRKFFMRTLEGWKIPSNNPMTVNQAFLLATRNGGLALRRDDLGVIKVGAKADLVVFDGLSPNMLGWSDPVAAIILHSNVGDVMDVMVDGEWRKRDGKLVVSHNRAEVEERFLQSAKRIQKVWEDAAVPTLKGEFMAGVHYAPTEVQSVVRGSR
ncbi:Metal-dependent hydrolase, composite domain superfamily [Fusarium oxysporum f. sp. vasinfectum]|uniref:Amidohydrolase-related domain-containing protein n=1 Tax=Fusarium oxysporum f. sp. vasinfectum 25433 TaxID=1089449 RepID=X0KWF6_FUSOX|nr:hypothetical protein FOTG_13924 [Fusarium oxysporum f. sp. vasinfectum 25433]KAK2686143.1 hypothetical protein QWA68_015105 [Fusarium oxysporum]KAK2935181.1 Metal-dependent hydrolase, composite domain superfamily [Fusarium oxysporum f. sp. vasinfectum]